MATTDLRRRKLEKVFTSFDVDQDGVIDQLDIIALAQIWCETYEVAPRSEGWQRIHSAGLKMWRDMRGRTDAEGVKRVTREEWVAWMAEPGFAEFVENSAVPFSLAVFGVADEDRDGRITMPQMMAAQSRSGMSEAETKAAFDLLDTDSDGYVTDAESAQAARDFYLSDDPDAPGNKIAGDF